MDEISFPMTEIELEKWMKNNCFNFDSYSINGNSIYEGYGIDKSGELFIWYYTERGERNNLKYFQTEAEIVKYAFEQINSDEWAKTHCIGFSTDLNKISELKIKLENSNVKYIEDKIPYYGIERPVYRVFVLGCDIQKTKQLKQTYWTEK